MNSSWQWPPHLGHHVLAAGGATYRAACLSPSLVTQLNDDEDPDLDERGSDTK
jgi:hypothetical protein